MTGSVDDRCRCLSLSLRLLAPRCLSLTGEIEAASLKAAGSGAARSADSLSACWENLLTAAQRQRGVEIGRGSERPTFTNSGKKTKKHVPVCSGSLRFITGLVLRLLSVLLFFHLSFLPPFLTASFLCQSLSILVSYFSPSFLFPSLSGGGSIQIF